MEQSSTRMAPVSTWCFIFSLILLLHGIQEASGAEEGKGGEEDYLEKCCGLGSSWASEKLRCERFSGPVAGVPASEQSACLETIDICCRKKFQDDDCKLGKADAKAGLACTRSETGPRRTPVGLGDFRRDCCEGCKLGIAAGTSGKTCGLKKINLRIPWDPAFTECCNEAATSTTRKQETSPTTAMSSTVVSTSQAADSDELESIDELNDPNLNFNLTVDLCELMGSLLCSETCVPTPGSYYCNCSAGSTLQADGRTCLPDVTSTATPRSTAAATPPSTTTTTTTTTTKVTSSTTPAKKSPATTKAKTNKPAKATARSTVKVSSSVTRPRTTRSLSTEPNEHNSLCPSGYRFTSSEICDDIDECSEGPINPCPPSSMCFNTKGSFRCFSISLGNNSADRCELGYRWDDALEQCLDIDECAENIHKCLIDGEICKNLDGSYECEIVCEKGYVFDSTYGACLDIDECVELINVCLRPDTVCVNSLGSYECVKVRDYNQLNEPNLFASNGTDYGRSGFDYEDLLEEEDIDECQIHEQPCAPEEVCRNTVAGYDCIPIGCPKGFAMAEDQTCRDVDECQENSHSCAEHERCQNTNGSFTCETPRSTPAPTTAEPPKIYCRKGFKANPARQRNHSEAVSSSELCIDVDECLEGPGCREHEKCSNLLGSYECSPLCGPGWFFQPQSKSCQDVDECLLGHHNCRRSQYCVNSPGGFRCEPLGSCAAGYRRLQNGSCVDIDECLEGLHTCSRDSHRYCVNRDGGYECITRLPSCPRGYEYSLLSRQCQDVDECRQARASCDTRAERCLNLPGGYRCERLPNDPNRPGHRKRPACPNGLVYEPELRKCAGRPTVTPPPSTTDDGTDASSSSSGGVSIAR